MYFNLFYTFAYIYLLVSNPFVDFLYGISFNFISNYSFNSNHFLNYFFFEDIFMLKFFIFNLVYLFNIF